MMTFAYAPPSPIRADEMSAGHVIHTNRGWLLVLCVEQLADGRTRLHLERGRTVTCPRGTPIPTRTLTRVSEPLAQAA